MTAPTIAAPKNIDEIRELIKKHMLGPEEKSYNRQLLMEGIENIRNRMDYNTKLKEAGNISLNVNQMGGWIHSFIRDTTGGRFNCNSFVIEWTVNGDKIVEFNPYTGAIAYANRS
jgi:hypothetical protein